MITNNALEGNIIKYYFYKIFTKRVFLPLIAIYLIDYGSVTIAQIALIASITGVVQFIMEIPSGYLADRVGHKKSLALGSFLSALSVLPYLFWPGYIGGLVASAGYFGSQAFVSGTIQAFMHETLLALGHGNNYSKIMAKGQSFGLFGNMILITVIPLTYVLNPKLPFILGFICLFLSFVFVLSFKSPPKRVPVEDGIRKRTIEQLRALARTIPLMRLFLVFLIYGIIAAGFDVAIVYRELQFKAVGIPVEYFGLFLGFGSLLAAVGARFIHHLSSLSPRVFYILDTVYFVAVCLLVGISKNPIIMVIAFALFPAYDRTRNIIFEDHVLKEFPYSHYKATIISIMNFFGLACLIWVPLVLGGFVGRLGFSMGYTGFGLTVAVLLLPILLVYGIVSIQRPAVLKAHH